MRVDSGMMTGLLSILCIQKETHLAVWPKGALVTCSELQQLGPAALAAKVRAAGRAWLSHASNSAAQRHHAAPSNSPLLVLLPLGHSLHAAQAGHI